MGPGSERGCEGIGICRQQWGFWIGGPFGASWVFGSERLQGCTPLIIELVDALDDVRMPALIAMGHVEAGDIHAILGELQHHVVFQ